MFTVSARRACSSSEPQKKIVDRVNGTRVMFRIEVLQLPLDVGEGIRVEQFPQLGFAQ